MTCGGHQLRRTLKSHLGAGSVLELDLSGGPHSCLQHKNSSSSLGSVDLPESYLNKVLFSFLYILKKKKKKKNLPGPRQTQGQLEFQEVLTLALLGGLEVSPRESSPKGEPRVLCSCPAGRGNSQHEGQWVFR